MIRRPMYGDCAPLMRSWLESLTALLRRQLMMHPHAPHDDGDGDGDGDDDELIVDALCRAISGLFRAENRATGNDLSSGKKKHIASTKTQSVWSNPLGDRVASLLQLIYAQAKKQLIEMQMMMTKTMTMKRPLHYLKSFMMLLGALAAYNPSEFVTI